MCPDWGVLTVSVEAGVTVDQGTLSDLRPFSCKFSHKIALVRCPYAFRLHRLAQNVGLSSLSFGARLFSFKFLRKIALMCVSISQARTKRAPKFWGAAFFLFQVSHKIPLVRCLCALRQCKSQTILQEFHGGALEVRNIRRSQPRPCRGPCAKILWRSWWNPVKGPYMPSHRSVREALVKILLTTSKRSLQDLAHVLIRISCENPAGIF